MRSIVIGFLVFVSVFGALPADAAPTRPKIPARALCRASDGALTARVKCKKTETRAVLTALYQSVVSGAAGPAGAAGPQGASGASGGTGGAGSTGVKGSINLENCRTVSASDGNLGVPSLGTLAASAECTQATEYLLTYGFNTNVPFPNRDASLKAVPRAQIISSSGAPYGVEITADRISTTSTFFLSVDAICCPKS